MFQGAVIVETKDQKPKKQPRRKVKNDPKFVSAARELRDRYLEEVNSGRFLPEAQGKYDVARLIDVQSVSRAQLPAAREGARAQAA
jgi:hypothetical protein